MISPREEGKIWSHGVVNTNYRRGTWVGAINKSVKILISKVWKELGFSIVLIFVDKFNE